MTIKGHLYPFSRSTVTTSERLSKKDLISNWGQFPIDRKNIYSKKMCFLMTVVLAVVPRSPKNHLNRGRVFLGPRDSSDQNCQTFAILSPRFLAVSCRQVKLKATSINWRYCHTTVRGLSQPLLTLSQGAKSLSLENVKTRIWQ